MFCSHPAEAVDLSAAPSAIVDLVDQLSNEGFGAETTTFGSRHNQVVVFKKQSCEVRVIADRSQWFAEMRLEGMDGWFDADVWRACLDDEDVAIEPAPLTFQVKFLLANWRRASLTDPEEMETCLLRTRSFRAYTRLGLSPP
jgi:hypothetical protein